MRSRETTIPAAVANRLVRGRVAADILLVIGASALIAIAAQVTIPLYPVPFTLQPLAVIFLGAALGAKRGAAAAALYLVEGFSGLPVFAGGHSGPAMLSAMTAGYLFSYPFAAWVSGKFSEMGWGHRIINATFGMLAALGVIYLGGWSWLSTFSNAATAFKVGVAPFILADIVKVALGAALLPYAEKIVARTTIEH
jgi:biotin transport system substrate-specific component